MRNSKQNVFSLAELKELGFEREDAGGFFYFIKYLGEDKTTCKAIASQDFEESESEDQRYTVTVVGDAEELTREAIYLFEHEQR